MFQNFLLRRAATLLGLLILVAHLSACNQVTVSSDLNQSQANEIIAELSSAGIEARTEKGAGARGKLSIVVDESDYSRAVTLISKKSLPSPARLTFEEMTAPSGFMPNSRELDAARLDRALALEIEQLIGALPNIERVSAVVRANHGLTDSASPALSLVIVGWGISQVESEQPNESSTGIAQSINTSISVSEQFRVEILKLVQQVFPGVRRDNITLILAESNQPNPSLLSNSLVQTSATGTPSTTALIQQQSTRKFIFWDIPQSSYAGLAIAVIACILGMGAIGVTIGYWISFSHTAKSVRAPIVSELEGAFIKSGSIRVKRNKGNDAGVKG